MHKKKIGISQVSKVLLNGTSADLNAAIKKAGARGDTNSYTEDSSKVKPGTNAAENDLAAMQKDVADSTNSARAGADSRR